MISDFKKFSKIVVVAVIAISILSVYLMSKLTLDYDFESFFPQDDQETVFYKNYREVFESDNDLILLGITNEKGIFNQEFLLEVERLNKDLRELAYVDDVFSIVDSIEAKRAGIMGEVYRYPAIKIQNLETYSVDSAYVMNHPDYVNNLVSEDGKSISIWIKHEQFLSKEKCDTLTKIVDEVLLNYSFDEVHKAGRAIAQKAYLDMMANEMVIFMSLSMFLIVVFLFIAFRSWWGVVIPVFIVLLAIIWNLAAIYILGHKIDLMLSILPTIIFVVGMSDAVHITTKYLDELRAGTEKLESIRVALREVGMATLLTSITTSIGFLSLLTSNILPISRFGVNMAIGVVLAFVLSYSILPVVFYVLKEPKIASKKIKTFDWKRVLAPSFIYVLRQRKVILILTGLLVMTCVWGISRIVSDNFLLEDLREDHYLRKEIGFFEKNFAGARPLEVALILQENFSLDLHQAKQMERVDDYLQKEFGLGAIVSPVKAIKKMNQIYNGGSLEYYTLPRSEEKFQKVLKFGNKMGILDDFLNLDKGLARIYGQSRDKGRKFYDGKLEEFNKFADTELMEGAFDVHVTGTARLMDINNENLSKTMIYGLMLAFLIIAIIVGVLFKSLKMVVLALIPNVLPLLMVAAFMGFYGIPLKVSTSIIFTIAFGIAVDDTIHFLSKFRIELSKNKPFLYALKRTYLSTGKAIIVTTAILCGGFLTLIFSDFLGTLYTGLLIGMTLFFAVISDLVVLPILLLLFYKKNVDKTT